MHIPQSMGYGKLAGVMPINGLYTSFVAVLVYVFLGKSYHASLGTFAVVSLMVGDVRLKYSLLGDIENATHPSIFKQFLDKKFEFKQNFFKNQFAINKNANLHAQMGQ